MIIMKNTLYYGDNLDILKRYIEDESIDLIYLDPPFKSNQDYNVLFSDRNGTLSNAQIKVFEDTWRWNIEAENAFDELLKFGGKICDVLIGIERFIGRNDMMAYLVMMAPRLIELRRVLKSTGSIYIHCDTTASHYLKIVMDAIFDPRNFKNEIIWKRSHTRSSISKIFRRNHDSIFFYTKTDEYFYNQQYGKLSNASLKLYHYNDKKGRYRLVPVLVSGVRHGKTGEVWRDIDPNRQGKSGMHWITIPDKLEKYEKKGLLVWPKRGKLPQLKYYLEENKGVPLGDTWDKLGIIESSSKESLGYPTQKPEKLLERIIKTSCPKDGVVLDPFCGCGTTVCTAHKLNRTWIGMDITHLAITLIKHRLRDSFGEKVESEYEVIGEPISVSGAKALAKQDRFQFQWWALGLVGARPVDQKKGADKGIDGRLFFRETEKGTVKETIISVKSGHVGVKDIRDLRGVIEREKAEIGVLITLEEPTKPMVKEAVNAGFYVPKGYETKYQRIQILTIEDIFNGYKIESPRTENSFKIKQAGKRYRTTQIKISEL